MDDHALGRVRVHARGIAVKAVREAVSRRLVGVESLREHLGNLGVAGYHRLTAGVGERGARARQPFGLRRAVVWSPSNHAPQL